MLPGWALVAVRWLLRGEVDRPRSIAWTGGPEGVLDCLVAYNEHGGFCIPRSSRHRPAAQDVMKGQVFEAETLDWIVARLGRGDVVDAGAYYGDFLPALSRGCAPGARVWAFEPNPESCRCAQITLALNDLRNVELRNAALGASSGSAPLRVADAEGRGLGGISQLVREDAGGGGCVEVEVVRLDDVIPPDRHVSLVHLDVEGFEREALEGGLETLRRCRPILVLESPPERDWFAAHVLSLGYRPTATLVINTVYTATSGPGSRPQ
jgi:FkbM family methyltransferase